MPSSSTRDSLVEAYLAYLITREFLLPSHELNFIDHITRALADMEAFRLLLTSRNLVPHNIGSVPKQGNLHLAWEYLESPQNAWRFERMLRVSPFVFHVIVELIKDHPIFHNNSSEAQTPVSFQLMVMLYRLGRYGNGASILDIARDAGIGDGTVQLFTERCFTAILSLHDVFVRPLTDEEKEVEKQWIDSHLGFVGYLWRQGWNMYNGTIVRLHSKPTDGGEGYFTRKSTYGMNLQIGNTPSNLRIVDYSLGYTGAAHDATAFEGCAASRHPEWLFSGEEFAWVDSAYASMPRTVPVYKKPASNKRENSIFNKTVSHLRVRSEHTMGALKQAFQCLFELRQPICNNQEHLKACHWIMVCIIIHNLVIDVEGSAAAERWAAEYQQENPQAEDEDEEQEAEDEEEEVDDEKRLRLKAELMEYRASINELD